MTDKAATKYNEKNHLVSKSNSLVESAQMKFSAMQQRIVHTALSQIRKGDCLTDEIMYKIPISAIIDLAGQEISGQFYNRTKVAALSLVSLPMTIKNNPDGSIRKNVLVCPIVQSVQYNNDSGEVWIRFNKDAIPYLSGLEGIGFTQYSIEEGLLCMDSAYAYRLHDLIARWGDLGMKEITIEDFRWMMGIDSDKYTRFNNLRKRVIEPAIQQVNEHSQFDVTVGYRKARRNIVALQFAFKPKNKKIKNKKIKKQKEQLILGIPYSIMMQSRLTIGKSNQEAAGYIKSLRNEKESWEDFKKRMKL